MDTPAPTASVEKTSPCIARQPILTSDRRSSATNCFSRGSGTESVYLRPERATSATIDALNMVGLDVLCDGHPAFINCSRQMLLTEYFALLPPNEVVVEIQERCGRRRSEGGVQAAQTGGYSIALDNFVAGDDREALVPYATSSKSTSGR